MSHADDPAVQPLSIESRGALFRLARRWRMILFCWLVLCAVLVFGAFQLARPTYEASATLEVTPSERISFLGLNPITGDDAVQAFMKAEQDAILSDRVLDFTLAAPATGTSRLVKRSTNPKSDVRQALTIRILPGTPKIQIALASRDRDEPAAIVNAVVGALPRSTLTDHCRPESVLPPKLDSADRESSGAD